MTNATTLLKRTNRPDMADVTAAIVADAKALALEWSAGSSLDMIGREAVATRNAKIIILNAAIAILSEQRDGKEMADLIRTYQKGDRAGFAFADSDRNFDLEVAAEEILAHAEAIAEAFRDEITDAAA